MSLLEGADYRIDTVNIHPGQDFLHMMARIEPALLELLIIIRSLRAQAPKAVQSLLFAGLVALGQQGLGMVGMFLVLVAVVTAGWFGHTLVLVVEL